MKRPHFSWLIATGCGIGYAPVAPGTLASAAAAALWYAFPLAPSTQWFVCGATVLIGTWAAQLTAKHARAKDPQSIVIDEIAGMWLALAGAPHTPLVLTAAFLLFRLFDIAKWPPMKQLERLPGGLGIMLDDVAAGLIARAILALAILFRYTNF